MKPDSRLVHLAVEPFKFARATWDPTARGFVFFWYASVGLRNLCLTRVVVVGLSWPPVRWGTRLMNLAEGEHDG